MVVSPSLKVGQKWHLGTGFTGNLGISGFMVGLDLKGHFQNKQFHNLNSSSMLNFCGGEQNLTLIFNTDQAWYEKTV